MAGAQRDGWERPRGKETEVEGTRERERDQEGPQSNKQDHTPANAGDGTKTQDAAVQAGRGKPGKKGQREEQGRGVEEAGGIGVGLEVGERAKGQKVDTVSPPGVRLIALSPPTPSSPCAGSS